MNRLTRLLSRALGDRAILSVQNPVVLGEHVEPQPDIAVLRPRGATGEWVDVGTSVGRQIPLSDQETGVELEFRVSAINKAGEGRPSNTVRAVL